MTSADIPLPQPSPALQGGYCKVADGAARARRSRGVARQQRGEARPAYDAGRALLVDPRLQRDERELLTAFRARLGEQLRPQPRPIGECAQHQVRRMRKLVDRSQLRPAQLLDGMRPQSEQQARLIDALSAQCPCAMQNRVRQHVAFAVVGTAQGVDGVLRRALIQREAKQRARKFSQEVQRVWGSGEQGAHRPLWKPETVASVACRGAKECKEQSVELLNVLEMIEASLSVGHRGAFFEGFCHIWS